MGKIPNFLNPPGEPDALTDLAFFEWLHEGKHLNQVHEWACNGPRSPEGLWERIHYLLEHLEGIIEGVHPEVVRWRSDCLLTLNLLHGGSSVRTLEDTQREVELELLWRSVPDNPHRSA